PAGAVADRSRQAAADQHLRERSRQGQRLMGNRTGTMLKTKSILAALILTATLATGAAMAQDDGHSTPQIEKQNWSFGGIFGTYDLNQLQRGFQVFRESCANCHSARLLAFRNLGEPGGPSFTEGQV